MRSIRPRWLVVIGLLLLLVGSGIFFAFEPDALTTRLGRQHNPATGQATGQTAIQMGGGRSFDASRTSGEHESPVATPQQSSRANQLVVKGDSTARALSDGSKPDDKPMTEEEKEYLRIEEAKIERGRDLKRIGIPYAPFEYDTTIFRPSPEVRARLDAIEAELNGLQATGLAGHTPQPDWEMRVFDNGSEVIYVNPAFIERFDRLTKERIDINQDPRWRVSEMRTGLRIGDGWGQRLRDGRQMTWYRRKDGSLIRQVDYPDGRTRRWVIGWTDLASLDIPPQTRTHLERSVWRDE